MCGVPYGSSTNCGQFTNDYLEPTRPILRRGPKCRSLTARIHGQQVLIPGPGIMFPQMGQATCRKLGGCHWMIQKWGQYQSPHPNKQKQGQLSHWNRSKNRLLVSVMGRGKCTRRW